MKSGSYVPSVASDEAPRESSMAGQASRHVAPPVGYLESTVLYLIECCENGRTDVSRDFLVSVSKALEELENYREAALYDATMEGPKFKGWNRSQLERARRITESQRQDEAVSRNRRVGGGYE